MLKWALHKEFKFWLASDYSISAMKSKSILALTDCKWKFDGSKMASVCLWKCVNLLESDIYICCATDSSAKDISFMQCSITSTDLWIGIVPFWVVPSWGTWALLPPAFERVVPDEQRHSLVLLEDYSARFWKKNLIKNFSLRIIGLMHNFKFFQKKSQIF